MSSTPDTALIFIPGAWHDASTWDGVRSQLEAVGYDTYALTNISVGVREPPVESHVEDAKAIRKKVREIVEERGRNVILVGHSYGGIPMSEAVQGLDRRYGEREFGVIGCVFVCAFMIPKGQSLVDWNTSWKTRRNRPDAGISPAAREFLKDHPTYYRLTDPQPFLYNDITPEEAAPWAKKLREQSAAVVTSNLESEAWAHVACTYVVCTEDKAVPVDMQRDMIAEAEKNSKFPIKVREIVAPHSPWLKHLPELVAYIREAAGENL